MRYRSDSRPGCNKSRRLFAVPGFGPRLPCSAPDQGNILPLLFLLSALVCLPQELCRAQLKKFPARSSREFSRKSRKTLSFSGRLFRKSAEMREIPCIFPCDQGIRPGSGPLTSRPLRRTANADGSRDEAGLPAAFDRSVLRLAQDEVVADGLRRRRSRLGNAARSARGNLVGGISTSISSVE